MHHQIVRWVVEHAVRFHQQQLERSGEIFKQLRRRVLEGRFVALGEDPGFKRKPRSIGGESQKIFVLGHDSGAVVDFLPDAVTKDAALFVNVILLGSLQFLHHVNGQNGQRDKLRVRVLERGAGGFSVVLEKQNVFEAAVLLEIEYAITKGPQNVFDPFRGKRGHGGIVVGRFDDDFVGAYAIHLVKHALGLLVQIAFDAERRELVRDDPDRPTRTVFLSRTAVGAWAIGQYLRRRLAFIAIAEGAESALDLHRFAHKVGRPPGAIRGNNHPPATDGVFS